MSSVCGSLDYKDAESHFVSSSALNPKNSSNGSKGISCVGSEDAQESEGDDSGYINQCVNEESNDNVTSKPISESLDDEGKDKNFATTLQDTASESMNVVVPIIPAIKGSREKHGKTLEKMSVTWAEDVYDPPPSIVSHTRSKKQQQQKPKSKDSLKKKKGKKGSKGSSKDKKSSSSSSSSSSSPRSKHSGDKFGWSTQMSIVAATS